MAFVQTATIKGGTVEDYETVMQRAYGGHALNDGEMFRVAGVGPDGLWVIDGWETREHCDASGEKVMPAIAEQGFMENMDVKEFEIHSLVLPG